MFQISEKSILKVQGYNKSIVPHVNNAESGNLIDIKRRKGKGHAILTWEHHKRHNDNENSILYVLFSWNKHYIIPVVQHLQ